MRKAWGDTQELVLVHGAVSLVVIDHGLWVDRPSTVGHRQSVMGHEQGVGGLRVRYF